MPLTSRYARKLKAFGFDQIKDSSIEKRSMQRIPYFVQGSGNVQVTFAFDEYRGMWIISKLVDLTDLEFQKRSGDVGELLKETNRVTLERRTQARILEEKRKRRR